MIRKTRRFFLATAAILALAAWVVLAQGAEAQGPMRCEGDGSISGQVTDTDGQAVEGASVILLEAKATAAGGIFYEVETDAEGRYESEGMCKGSYYAMAQIQTMTLVAAGFHDPDADGQPDPATISDDAPDAADIDIRLEAQDAGPIGGGGTGTRPSEPCDDGAGSIEGHVLDADGNAVAGARVQIDGPSMRELESDEDGAYRGENLCEGSYGVMAMDLSGDALRFGVHDVDGDGMPDEVQLSADAPDASDIDVVVEACEGGTVVTPGPGSGGSAACDNPTGSIEGRVFEADGKKPAKNVTVVLMRDDATAMGPNDWREVETEANGKYRFEDLCPGSYVVMAWLETDAGTAMGMHDADGDGEPDAVRITVDAPEAKDIDVTLSEIQAFVPWEPAPACDSPEASVAGKVTDAEGKAVEGVKVMLLGLQGSSAEAETDASGDYLADGLCAGDYIALAILEGAAAEASFGFHDPDGDGEPDHVRLDADDSAATGVDIILDEQWVPILATGTIGVGDCPDCVGLAPILPPLGGHN